MEKNRDLHNNRYVWVWNSAPSRNPTRQLIRISPRKVGCTVLFMPNSDYHDFKLAPGGKLPAKVVSTSAFVNEADGGHYSQQEYVLNASTGMYGKFPTCYVVRHDGKLREKKNCQAAIEE